MNDFKTWWETEGSAIRPSPNEDIEEFAKRITQISWSNGEYVEREACVKVIEDFSKSYGLHTKHCIAAAIRARN